MKVKTEWKYSPETEAERLIDTAHGIVVGFFRINNFVVLPINYKVIGANVVIFPDLPYTKIPRFWDQVKRINVTTIPEVIDKKLIEQTANILKSANLPKPNFGKTKALWEKCQNEVINEIYKIIPTKNGLIEKITIYPTVIGTSCSFNLIDPKTKKANIGIFLREDQGIHAITEAILSSITRLDVFNNLGGIWQESELLVDWLITHSSLSKVLQKYEDSGIYTATVKGTRTKQQAGITQVSEDFYKKLGIPSFNKPFSLNGLMPEINKAPVENLSIKERLILKKLIEKSNSVISFDEIADEVFNNENDFSLYAIAKTMQRLRDKLEANGISGSYIQTLRGKGYVLKN